MKKAIEELQNLQQSQHSASWWSAFILVVPFIFMNLSLGSFLLGLGVYLGFVWTRDLDSGAGKYDSRNIFILFLVVVTSCLYLYAGPAAYKKREFSPVRKLVDYQGQLE